MTDKVRCPAKIGLQVTLIYNNISLNGDGEASKDHGKALKIDSEEVKCDRELKSNGEAFSAKKRH